MIVSLAGKADAPATIGRYRVIDRLGKGAMGTVYRARDEQTGREVAVKIMMADLAREPETRARFCREAQVMSRLRHPNIVSMLETGEEDGRLYLVMELLHGRSLTEFLADPASRTIDRKLDLMIQVCEGLAVAHDHGVFHRDIKPGNLFVQADGGLKIFDFGMARLADSSLTARGLILGTPGYMSPEQACGKTVDARSDIFSAGAVFYFILTDHRPFQAPSLPVMLQKIASEDPPPIRDSEAPAPLAEIVMKALQKDPARRYQRFTDMAADLGRVRSMRAQTTDTFRPTAAATPAPDLR